MTEFKLAGFWIRFLAVIIDTALLMIVSASVFSIAGAGSEESLTLFLNILFIVITIYMWIKWGGKTPGKHLLKIRVISMDGTDMTLKQGLVRYLGYMLSSVLFLLGYVMVGFRKDKRGLHDLIAGTQVVYYDE